MKLRKVLVVTAAATALIAGVAGPASAADTTATFALTGGALTLTAPTDAALTDAPTGTLTITGSLGATSVSDLRGGTIVWVASGSSTAFTGTLGSSSTAVAYTGGAVTEVGTITVADGGETALSGVPDGVIEPSSLSGNNTATWNPTVAVTMPAGALVDAYTGTVTTSVL